MPAMDYAKVAQFYDLYTQTEIDVPFFIKEAKGCRRVLELTCGTGRLSIPLIQAGIPLTCLDNSAEMLTILRRKLHTFGLNAAVYKKDMTDFSLPQPFDLILIPFNAFAEITDPLAQQKTLSNIHAHIGEYGRLIVTLHNPAIRLQQIDGEIHMRGKFPLPQNSDNLILSSIETYDEQNQLVTGKQYYELRNHQDRLISRFSVDIQFQLHSKENFESLAFSQGFKRLALYGDYERNDFSPESSPFMVWVLGKR